MGNESILETSNMSSWLLLDMIDFTFANMEITMAKILCKWHCYESRL